MADDNRTTCEVLETLLKSTECVHVDIIGRLVKEKHVTALFQCHCKVQTVTLTTREHATLLLLVSTREVEA